MSLNFPTSPTYSDLAYPITSFKPSGTWILPSGGPSWLFLVVLALGGLV